MADVSASLRGMRRFKLYPFGFGGFCGCRTARLGVVANAELEQESAIGRRQRTGEYPCSSMLVMPSTDRR